MFITNLSVQPKKMESLGATQKTKTSSNKHQTRNQQQSYLNPILGGLFLHPILGGGGQICPPT